MKNNNNLIKSLIMLSKQIENSKINKNKNGEEHGRKSK